MGAYPGAELHDELAGLIERLAELDTAEKPQPTAWHEMPSPMHCGHSGYCMMCPLEANEPAAYVYRFPNGWYPHICERHCAEWRQRAQDDPSMRAERIRSFDPATDRHYGACIVEERLSAQKVYYPYPPFGTIEFGNATAG